MNIKELIKNNACVVVDVRSREEFMSGNVENSVNIPLNEIPDRVEELKQYDKPLVLCCASGGRSAQATGYLTNFGLQCFNAGSWMDVNYFQTFK